MEYDNTMKENHFLEDRLLRKWGFQIVSRKSGESPLWKLTNTGDTFTQEEALELAKDFQQDDYNHETKDKNRKATS